MKATRETRTSDYCGTQVSDGLPFTPQISGDALGLTTTSTIDLPNRITTGSCATAVNPGNFTAYLKTQCFTFPNPSTLLGNAGRIRTSFRRK